MNPLTWPLQSALALPFRRLSPAPPNPVDPAPQWPPGKGSGRDGGPRLRRPNARLHYSPASLSLYPWDKCLIPQGVKGKINHPGEISQPADLAGERQREIGCLADWLGPPLRGGKMLALRLQMGHIRVGESRPRHLGKSLLMRFRGRWLSPLPGPCPPSGQTPAPLPAFGAVACFLSPALEAWPCHSGVWLQALW